MNFIETQIYAELQSIHLPPLLLPPLLTAEKMKFSIMDFISKCDQFRRKLRIWSHLLKKSLMGNFIFCVVTKKHFTKNALVWISSVNVT